MTTSDKKYEVWINDEDGGHQPMSCYAKNKTEARQRGRDYIRMWHLVGATITKIVEV